jgi:hypothetical protein
LLSVSAQKKFHFRFGVLQNSISVSIFSFHFHFSAEKSDTFRSTFIPISGVVVAFLIEGISWYAVIRGARNCWNFSGGRGAHRIHIH